MKLLERYILFRVAKLSFAALVPVLAIIWIIQALRNVNLVTDSGQSISSFLLLAALILPTIIPAVLPFAVVIGTAQSLTSMNNDSELTVIDASGAPRRTVMRPIILFALGISLLSFSIDNFVEPTVRAQARLMVANAYADLLSAVIDEKTFRRIEDGLYVQIDKREKGRLLKGLFIADERKPDSKLLYYAREGAIDAKGTSLIMKDGEVHRQTPDGRISIIHFQSYSFDLSELTQSRGQPVLRAIDRDLTFLFNPDPKDQVYAVVPNQFTAELHRRLTDWTLPLIYGLIAILSAGDARSHRQARLHPMVAAMVWSFAHRWGAFYLSSLIEQTPSYWGFLYVFYVGSGGLLVALLWSPILRRHVSAPLRAIETQMRRLWTSVSSRRQLAGWRS
ncbi:MAG: hypothetical protein RIR97_1164 [Pseudomonadota bacterium]